MTDISMTFSKYSSWRAERDKIFRTVRRMAPSADLPLECAAIDDEWSTLFTLVTDQILYRTENNDITLRIEAINMRTEALRKKLAVMLLTA